LVSYFYYNKKREKMSIGFHNIYNIFDNFFLDVDNHSFCGII